MRCNGHRAAKDYHFSNANCTGDAKFATRSRISSNDTLLFFVLSRSTRFSRHNR